MDAPERPPGPPMDLATVVFAGDVEFLRLQARSVELFVPPEDYGQYLIVVNERDAAALTRTIRDDILPSAPGLADRVRLCSPADLGVVLPEQPRGWRVQQSLKLAISRVCGSDRYLMLDAKNHFVSPTRATDFADDHGRFRVRFGTRGGSQVRWLADSLALFDQPVSLATRPAPPTTTPHLLDTALARALTDHIEARFGTDIALVFQHRMPHATEFFLYYAYALRAGADVYAPGNVDISGTLFRVWPSQPKEVDRVLTRLETRSLKLFAVHRGRIAKLEPKIIDRITAAWASIGLVPSQEEGRRILAATAEPPQTS